MLSSFSVIVIVVTVYVLCVSGYIVDVIVVGYAGITITCVVVVMRVFDVDSVCCTVVVYSLCYIVDTVVTRVWYC